MTIEQIIADAVGPTTARDVLGALTANSLRVVSEVEWRGLRDDYWRVAVALARAQTLRPGPLPVPVKSDTT